MTGVFMTNANFLSLPDLLKFMYFFSLNWTDIKLTEYENTVVLT